MRLPLAMALRVIAMIDCCESKPSFAFLAQGAYGRAS
jgi:hypothetical protein